MSKRKKLETFSKKAERLEALKAVLPQEEPASPPVESNDVRSALFEAREAARKAVINEAFEAPNQHVITNTYDKQQLAKERELLERALLAEKRELAIKDFWYFFTQVLFPRTWMLYYLEDFHRPLADILQGMLSCPGSNQLFILPREHRKTYMIFGFIIWLIIRDPNIRIQLIGAKEKTSAKWATLIRNAFLEGSTQFGDLQAVFPDFVIERRGNLLLQALQFIHPKRDRALADPTLQATYLAVTGAGGRADVQIFDDPYERRNVSNPTQSMKSLQQTLDLFPLVETAATAKYRLRIFNATRWAYHDPIGTLLGERHDETAEAVSSDEMPPFQAVVRHAFEDPDRLCEECPEHVVKAHPHGHPDVEKGDAILYPIITREALMARYREYCADPAKGESLWYHQYQNVCLAPSDQKFQADWFVTGHHPTFAAPRLRALMVDSADKDFQKEGAGDYMVALMGEYDDTSRLMLVHGLRSRSWTRDEFIRRIIAWCQATGWWPSLIGKEKFGNDNFLTQIRSEFLARDRPVYVKPIIRPGATGVSYMKKLDWIAETLQGVVERAELIIGSAFPGELKARLIYELCQLGQVKHEDLADCTALFFSTEVRPAVVSRAYGSASNYTPPELGLYTPGSYQRQQPLVAVPQSPLEAAMQGARFQAVLPMLPSLKSIVVEDDDAPALNVRLDL